MTSTPYELAQPLDMHDARDAARRFGEQRREARKQLERCHGALAEAERAYRKARAQAYVIVDAPTAGARDAEVDERTADLRYERDIAKGLIEAAKERLNEIDGERASFHQLTSWSARVDVMASEERPA